MVDAWQGDLTYALDAGSRETIDLPLASARGYYLSLWSDDCVEGRGWDTAADDLRIFGWPVFPSRLLHSFFLSFSLPFVEHGCSKLYWITKEHP